MRTLVLQHIACEPPGAYEDVLRAWDAEIHRVELDAGEALPDWREFAAIVSMGGPMSARDEIDWLIAERRMIAEAVRGGAAFFGACLGSQLLAASLGARVYAGPEPEVGVLPVTLTDAALADPVLAGLPRELLTLQWHGDTFDLPDGAVALASSPAYANQAFRWGERAYAFQFHLEVTPRMAAEWSEVPEYADSLARTLGPGSFPALLREIAEHAEQMNGFARRPVRPVARGRARRRRAPAATTPHTSRASYVETLHCRARHGWATFTARVPHRPERRPARRPASIREGV